MDSQMLDKIDQKLDRVLEKHGELGNRVTVIETDLRYHIKRTDDLQTLAEEFKRYKWMVMGGIVVLGPLVTKLIAMIFN